VRRTPSSEKAIILVLAAVQFVNILDFMMVMPMGPDFAHALGIPMEHLGLIGGSYTASACVAGFLTSLFLDRFDRRAALLFSLAGLGCATALGAAAQGLNSLLAARVLAGLFGGPASSVGLSIVADLIPPARRGRAMGVIMSSFSLASILGVPLGLELARAFSWRMPFLAMGALCFIALAAAAFILPALRGHLVAERKPTKLADYSRLFQGTYLVSYIAMILGIFSTFLMVPNLAAYLQFNLGWPRASMGLLYLVGGCLTLLTTRFGGIIVDRHGAAPTIFTATALMAFVLIAGFIIQPTVAPVLLLFPCFMLANSLRFMTLNTLSSQVPRADERARFMSVQSGLQHLVSAIAAFLSSALLQSSPSGRLLGMPKLALLALSCSVFIPFFTLKLERSLRRTP
jgi:predicted MFS family arabinose efflux permease